MSNRLFIATAKCRQLVAQCHPPGSNDGIGRYCAADAPISFHSGVELLMPVSILVIIACDDILVIMTHDNILVNMFWSRAPHGGTPHLAYELSSPYTLRISRGKMTKNTGHTPAKCDTNPLAFPPAVIFFWPCLVVTTTAGYFAATFSRGQLPPD